MTDINLDLIDDILLPYQFKYKDTASKFDNYISAIAYLDMEEGVSDTVTGSQSAWIVSLTGLLAVFYYDQTGDEKYKTYATKVRDWIVANLVTDTEFNDTVYLPNDYPDEHYTGQTGTRYCSALGQTALIHLMLRFDDCDYALIEQLLAKFAKSYDQFGLFATYDGYVIWEEVASPYKPSYILNGGQVGGHQIDQIIKFLPTSMSRQANALRYNNESYKHFNLEYVPKHLFFEIKSLDNTEEHEYIRYDFRDLMVDDHGFINKRDPGHYAHRIAQDYVEDLVAQGYPVDPAFLAKLTA